MKVGKKRILTVVAHPDDEVLGCGGTLARYARNGDDCHILIMAEGVTSRDPSRDLNKRKVDLQKIKEQARKAAEIIGAKSVEFLSFPDNRMDSIPLLEVVKAVELFMKSTKPQIVYTHHHGDLNIDHSITAKAVITATRPVPESEIKEVYSFEILSSTEWVFNGGKSNFSPNVFIDIKDTLSKKIKALHMYSSEIAKFPHPRSPEAIKVLAQRRGSQAGLKAAEGFCLIRKVD